MSEHCMEDRITRIEALLKIEDTPHNWITKDKIKRVRDTRGCSLDEARRLLIKNFGDEFESEYY